MWFAKLLGGSRDEDSGDEPARFSSPPVSRPAQPAPVPKAAKGQPVNPAAKKGFDPYNSGAFQRQNAWERVIRR